MRDPGPISDGNYGFGLIVLGLATFLMAETAFAFRELTTVAFGVGSGRLTARLIPISDGNYGFGLIVLGLATFLMAETAFAFRELTTVAFGVGSGRLTARLIPISDGNYRCGLFGSGVGNFHGAGCPALLFNDLLLRGKTFHTMSMTCFSGGKRSTRCQ